MIENNITYKLQFSPLVLSNVLYYTFIMNLFLGIISKLSNLVELNKCLGHSLLDTRL